MGKGSKIEWTEHTFNPIWGCTKVSEGCTHCYAETWAKRTGFKIWGADAERRTFGDKHWAEPLKWQAEAERAGVMHRVFCGSMCDIMEDREELVDARERVFRLADATPNLLWLFLTKRPENANAYLPARWSGSGNWPRNVMLGVTIENQKRLAERAVHVAVVTREFPGARFFASCEPLLSALEWQGAISSYFGSALDLFSWVIGGGESGPGARPMHPEWISKLRDDCRSRTDMGRPWPVPFLFKQWGDWAPKQAFANFQEWNAGSSHGLVMRDGSFTSVAGRDIADPEFGLTCADPDGNDWSAAMARVGKVAAGRALGGRTWDGVPSLAYGPQLPGVENYGAVEVTRG